MGNAQLYKVYVINLDIRKDRLKYIDNVLKQAGILYKRFPAVNGNLYTHVPEITASRGYQDLHCLGSPTRDENLAHVGCYLSHLGCIKMIANGIDNFGLILEDDAKFIVDNSTIKHSIDDVVKNNQDCDIIWFNGSGTEFEFEIIQKYEMPTWGLQGYMISKNGAKILYNLLKPNSDWINNKETCLIDIVMPLAVKDGNLKWKVYSLIDQNKKFGSNIAGS